MLVSVIKFIMFLTSTQLTEFQQVVSGPKRFILHICNSYKYFFHPEKCGSIFKAPECSLFFTHVHKIVEKIISLIMFVCPSICTKELSFH